MKILHIERKDVMTSAVVMFAGGLVSEHMQSTAELRSQWA